MRSGLEGVSTKCSSSDVDDLEAYGKFSRSSAESGRDGVCDGKGGFAKEGICANGYGLWDAMYGIPIFDVCEHWRMRGSS